jgi:hypothetical protein
MRRLTFFALLLLAAPAAAQHRSAPTYHDWAYYNLQSGPSIEVRNGLPRPHLQGGFYATGVSRHGPTVATYAPAPAVIVDSGRHHSGFPKRGFGLGWLGTRTSSPRPAAPTVNVYP